MTCEQARTLCQLMLDGELTAGERARLNEHLDDCLECRRFREWLEETALLVAVEDLEAPPAGLADRILDAVVEQTPATKEEAAAPPNAGDVIRTSLAPISFAAEGLRRIPGRTARAPEKTKTSAASGLGRAALRGGLRVLRGRGKKGSR